MTGGIESGMLLDEKEEGPKKSTWVCNLFRFSWLRFLLWLFSSTGMIFLCIYSCILSKYLKNATVNVAQDIVMLVLSKWLNYWIYSHLFESLSQADVIWTENSRESFSSPKCYFGLFIFLLNSLTIIIGWCMNQYSNTVSQSDMLF